MYKIIFRIFSAIIKILCMYPECINFFQMKLIYFMNKNEEEDYFVKQFTK